MEDLEGLSLVDLRLIAKKMGVKGVTSYRKQELLDLLKEKQKEENTVKVSGEKTVTQKAGTKSKKKEKAEKKETTTEQAEKKEVPAEKKEASTERTEKKRTEKNSSTEHNSKEEDNNKRNAYNKKAMTRYNDKQQRKDNSNNNSNNNNNNNKKEGKRTEEVVTERQQKYTPTEMEQLDSGEVRNGILEVLSEGYGFIRCDNYLPGEEDVYVSPALIRKYHLRTGDILEGNINIKRDTMIIFRNSRESSDDI